VKTEHEAWRASVGSLSDEDLVEALSQGGHDLADPDDTTAAATEILKRLRARKPQGPEGGVPT
jgi:hypothetical protein